MWILILVQHLQLRGGGSTSIQSDNLIVLDSEPAFSKEHIAYVAEQNGFNGAVDLTGLSMLTADGATLTTALNALPTDQKAAIKTVNLQLQSGSFGGADLQLGALTGFTGLTINVDRNGAIDEVDTYGSLVTVTNNTTHTVNLTDAEFHNMSTFDNESSAHWIGYLTHELNSAASSYTLDLTVHSALVLDSANAVTALNEALKALPASLKAKAALLKVKSSTNGELGTSVAGFTNLANITVDYTAASVTAMTIGFSLITPTLYHYISDARIVPADATEWTRFFNYNLNNAAIGGIEQTTLVIDQRLSDATLTVLIDGLNVATARASLTDLTLNLASSFTTDRNIEPSGLTAIETPLQLLATAQLDV